MADRSGAGLIARLGRYAPGVALCVVVAGLALAAERLESRLLGSAPFEALVLAILIGALARSLRAPGARFFPGVELCAKQALEVAVVLLGASISFGMIAHSGAALGLAIVGAVAVTLTLGYALGRALGLPWRIATLIACGNAICGNSAIAAVAPVIGADGDDVAASISFTAILGVVAVLSLPALMPLLHLDARQYGVVAGLSVYAVPQVLAAAAPAGMAAIQIGTLVKLMRVLTLGPVVLVLSLLVARRAGRETRPSLKRLAPWFILGFLALAALRSLGLVPAPLLAPMASVSSALTILAMAALGLGVDLAALRKVGGRAAAATTASLLVLVAIAVAVVTLAPLR